MGEDSYPWAWVWVEFCTHRLYLWVWYCSTPPIPCPLPSLASAGCYGLPVGIVFAVIDRDFTDHDTIAEGPQSLRCNIIIYGFDIS
jgi:hypothetical protein